MHGVVTAPKAAAVVVEVGALTELELEEMEEEEETVEDFSLSLLLPRE